MGARLAQHPPPLERILLVEDEALVRLGLAEFLRECGYRVLEASDAKEASDILEYGPCVDLLISDVRMPGGVDGFELARRTKANCPEVQVIMMSGFPSEAERSSRGVTDGPILMKPYSRKQLLSRIEDALKRRAAKRPDEPH
jgi:CheY-like chemotaxis protein